MKLRSVQEEILKYEGGKMAISAVPGSGKTFALALLAVKMLTRGMIDPESGESILIVTYTNTGVENFRAAIRRQLLSSELQAVGFDVRTIHSLALEIIRLVESGTSSRLNSFLVLDALQSTNVLSNVVEMWGRNNQQHQEKLMNHLKIQGKLQWKRSISYLFEKFITTVKNRRVSPEMLLEKLNDANQKDSHHFLLLVLAEIYLGYQNNLGHQGVFDFNDIVWHAVDLLHENEELALTLSRTWRYVLEDEAQDSIPLQQDLLESITQHTGNWVRVGDPNQAIMSTFTAADPQQLRQFLELSDVKALTMEESGRSSQLIIDAANKLIDRTCTLHEVPEIRHTAFRYQRISPVSPGDAQQNPESAQSAVRIRVYLNREDHEIPQVSLLASKFVHKFPSYTAAILVPTNDIGRKFTKSLSKIGAPFDERLRNSGRSLAIVNILRAALSLLSDPLRSINLADTYNAFFSLQRDPTELTDKDRERIQILLRSVTSPETLLQYPQAPLIDAIPFGIATDEELEELEWFADEVCRIFQLPPLPVDDLVLAIIEILLQDAAANRLVEAEADLAQAYLIVGEIRQWQELNPDWRLPDFADELSKVVSGQIQLPGLASSSEGFEPGEGRITLTTQHGAKGLEWDAVFLTGLDDNWIPNNLEVGAKHQIGNFDLDLSADMNVRLKYLIGEDPGIYPGRSAAESALIDLISERLRLFYVGITRARRYLHLSRSRQVTLYNRIEKRYASDAVSVIQKHIQSVDPITNISLDA